MQELTKSDLVSIRDYAESDKNFVFSTWLRGLYYGESYFSQVPKGIFMENYHEVIEKTIDPLTVSIKVACLKDEPDVILGYAVLAHFSTHLHYVFVKKAWRNIGIAKSLVPVSIKTVSHLTHVGRAVLQKHPEVVFNPFK